MKKRLIIIANRLPITVEHTKAGDIVRDTSGGLSSSIKSFLKCDSECFRERVWMGAANCSKNTWTSVTDELEQQNCKYFPLFLSDEIYEDYYKGFSNSVIWPLFHSFPSYINYEKSFFEAYLEANNSFADKVSLMVAKDDIIWIHDYHLLPLAALLRAKYPFLTIGFFLHIPFPGYEIFRTIPEDWQNALIQGVLGADLIGFQTNDDAARFIECAQKVLSVAVDTTQQKVCYAGRQIKVGTFPISVDYEQFQKAFDDIEVGQLRRYFVKQKGDKKMLFSVDRLDYTKGIINRLKAFKEFLLQNPEYLEKVVFKLVVVPSRAAIGEYNQKKKSIEAFVCSLNSELGSIGWQPVVYYYNHLSFDVLIALYTAADIALITPIRDGMNLVSKEFVASRKDKKGVLILSEMAGAIKELTQALPVNPNDIQQIADAIKSAVEMPEEEQSERITAMQFYLSQYDVKAWAGNFLSALNRQDPGTQEVSVPHENTPVKIDIRSSYHGATRRLLLLDYDGTCMPISLKPMQVSPDPDLIQLLTDLASDPKNDIYIISGRESDRLEEWLGELPVGLIAEHGMKKRGRHSAWELQAPVSKGCMLTVKEILDSYTARCPGSFIEEKECSLAWHYRGADAQMAAFYAREIYHKIEKFLRPSQGHILMGKMVLEVLFAGVDKGMAVRKLLEQEQYDFILAAGDDTTDEYMFKELISNSAAFSIKIGSTQSFAKSTLGSPFLLRKLLHYISRNDISRFHAIRSFSDNHTGAAINE